MNLQYQYPVVFFLLNAFLNIMNTAYSQDVSSQPITHKKYTAFEVLQRMIDSTKNIKTLKFNLIALERVREKYLKAASQIKISYSPSKTIYFIDPEKKIEVLYIEGKNNNKAYVKHPLLPFGIFLDPSGSMMKKDHHYTIHELGFEYIASTIQLALSKEQSKYLNHLHYLGIHEKNGKQCHTLMYESSKFDYMAYTIKTKETVVSISRKLNINEYILRDKNKLYDEFGYLKTGSTILVPTMYCKKAFLYIDIHTFLPVSVNLYDDKGLLESYDYTEVKKNIVFSPHEFDKHFKNQKF